ncbi:MAG: primosomal protein N' [Anaerolineae bacterium]|nr:primosomal protein N' [Thermoflexales bacterium]MDW8408058.1 primosomal protein N' [Anaerolineae bacterium]
MTQPAEHVIAEVALLSEAVRGKLSYRVPEALCDQAQPGAIVVVPLRKRFVAAVIVGIRDAGADTPSYALRDLKTVVPIAAPAHTPGEAGQLRPALSTAQLHLAEWMQSEYHAALGRCLSLMVPPGLTPKSATVYELADPARVHQGAQGAQTHILNTLRRRGALTEPKLGAAVRAALRTEASRRAEISRGTSTPHDRASYQQASRSWRVALKELVQAGVVVAREISAPEIGTGRSMRTAMAQLTLSPETLDIVLSNLEAEAARRPHWGEAMRRRAEALRYLLAHNGFAWADWISAETGANRADLVWLAKRDYIVLGDAERWRDPLADIDYVVKTAPPLTDDQQRAWDAIRVTMEQHLSSPSLAPSAIFLLRGVTGSGKTEIYMRAVELALAHGRGAIVLVPEISLTPQTARRFLERFPGRVALIHSRLKAGERYDTWRRIWAGELPVVVGARSALFAPLPQIGVIVLDEEHDPSYKQNAPPYYHARDVAMAYARLAGATVILGSATPSLEMWRAAMQADDHPPASSCVPVRVLDLPNRVRGHANRLADQQARLGITAQARRETDTVLYQPLPDVHVVDMRAELRAGNFSIFSGALQTALAETLRRGEQAILFLNRRGAASCVICRDCGYVMRCPHDGTPLTYHLPSAGRRPSLAQSSVLKCHQCDHLEPPPSTCPSCGGTRIRYVGLGTQKVESAVIEQFPTVRVIRWDRDAASTGHAGVDQMVQRFVNRQADVLIGTQMIAKGLDLPLVTLVGVVLADVGLFLPDFRASERVFALIEQVAGRAGRGLLPGRVIVQTYNPEHPAIVFAAQHDVAGFARYELGQRRALNLPPFTRLVRFELSDPDEAKARLACEMLARQLRRCAAQPEEVIGPAQAYFARRVRRGAPHWRWHVFIRTNQPGQLLRELAEAIQSADQAVSGGCIVDVDPLSVL